MKGAHNTPGYSEFLQSLALLLTKQALVTVFIAGLPGSGKITFARQLCERFDKQSVFFSLDWFVWYSSAERRSRIQEVISSGDKMRMETELNPLGWYDFDAFYHALETLKTEHHITLKRLWNQKSGEKDLAVSLSLPQTHTLIVCEGSELLGDDALPHADLIVFLDVSLKVSHERLKRRDQHRSDSKYLDIKLAITKKYDIPFNNTYKKNAHFVFSS